MRRLLIILSWLCCAGAAAHPHAWMDITLAPILNAQGEIIALKQRWVFDPLYAQMLAEPILLAKDEASAKAAWSALEADTAKTLHEAHYFTFPTAQFADDADVRLENSDGELAVVFELALRQPTKRLTYQVFEPEYYVEMLHAATQETTFLNGCTLVISDAQPDPARYAEAAALDKNETGDPMLGRYFAETGVLQCP